MRLGRLGEDLASAELVRRGYEIEARNWRCALGEVDIVARQDDLWAFFEVRTRRGCGYGTPEESLTPTKRQRMMDVGLAYLAAHEIADADWRVGAVAIEMDGAGRVLRLDVHASIG